MLKTRLTELFGLGRPIVLAPMAAGATSGHLAAAVSTAGGLGLFGGVDATPKCLTTKTCLRARCPAVAGAVASICGNFRSTTLGTISARRQSMALSLIAAKITS